MHLQLILYTYRKLQPSKWKILYQNNVQLFVSFCCCEILLSLEYTQKYHVWVIVLQCHEDVMLNVYEYWKLRWSLFPAWNKLWRCKPCYTEGLHPTGAVRNMNIAFTPGHIPESPWQESPVSLLRLFCFKCDPLNGLLPCLCQLDPPGVPKCKATVSRQKTRKSDSKTCPCDSTGVLLLPHPDAFWKWQNFLITRRTKALLRALMNSSHDAGTVMLSVKVWTASVSQH